MFYNKLPHLWCFGLDQVNSTFENLEGQCETKPNDDNDLLRRVELAKSFDTVYLAGHMV